MNEETAVKFNKSLKARSHGHVVKAEDTQPRGRGIESMLLPLTGWNINEEEINGAKWSTPKNIFFLNLYIVFNLLQ